MTGYVSRDIAGTIRGALKEMPVVVLTGMRQTGKSTFLQEEPWLKKRRYVTLDDFAHLEAAREDPDRFIESDGPLTIDEAQKCPAILTAIKRHVDRKRTAGKFLLSGSANFAILKGISESLAGRAVYFTMHPFNRREITGRTQDKPFLKLLMEQQKLPKIRNLSTLKTQITSEDILQGGMPSVYLGGLKTTNYWFKGYEQTYLERDVREFSQVGSIIQFRHLLHLAAMRTGQVLSTSQIGRDAKLNVTTTSRYLSILEASFIIYRLSPYLSNRSSRLIKSPKLYFSDSGLACYLAGIKSLDSELLRGAMLETYVAQNLAGIIDSCWPEAQLYFWNIQGRHEVDFIIEDGNKCIAIEVKGGSRWEPKDLTGLKAFLSTTKPPSQCIAAVLAYNGTEAVQLGDRLWAIPTSCILS